MTDPTATTQLTTEQVVAALAASLLPLAGPAGIAAAAAVPALEQLLDAFKAQPAQNFSIADLQQIVATGNANLAQLAADINAQQGAKS